jgi:hypothetical protein
LVKKQLDIYARELQHALFMAYDVKVDTTTITCASHRHGFTRKNIARSARESVMRSSDLKIKQIFVE